MKKQVLCLLLTAVVLLCLLPAAVDAAATPIQIVWQDNNNLDNTRPPVVYWQLTTATPMDGFSEITADNDWKAGVHISSSDPDIGIDVWIYDTDLTTSRYSQKIEGNRNTGWKVYLTQESRTISGTITWDDDNNRDGKRPTSVKLTLKPTNVDGGSSYTSTASANSWSYSFQNLPVYVGEGANAEAIQYDISVDNVEGYTADVTGDAITGFTITMKHTPEKIAITVSTNWDDDNNRDGLRPSDITVTVLEGGAYLGNVYPSWSNNWGGSISNQYKYEDGEEIKYSISVSSVNGYDTDVTGDATTGFTITMKHTPATIDIPVTIMWDDDNNRDGKRPETLNLGLVVDATRVANAEVQSTSSQYSFTNQYKYQDGQEIKYAISVGSMADYSSSRTGDATNGFTLTLTHTPEMVKIPISAIWNDDENRDELRPDELQIQVLKNGQTLGRLYLSKTYNWEGSISNQHKYEGGKEIQYSISVNNVDGYTAEVTGDAKSSYTIILTHTPQTIDIPVYITWNDYSDRDGKRPATLNLRLLGDGSNVASEAVSSTQYSFKNQYKYNDGQEIKYTISVDSVAEYTAGAITGDATNGFFISLTHTPETIDIPVSITWDDGENRDGKRPANLKVVLLGDGSEVANTQLSESTNWEHSFTNQYKYENGQEIQYTVSADPVDKYTAGAITGDAATGYSIPQSYTPEKVSIPVSINWDDENNRDGKRPANLKVVLLGDGSEVANTQLSESTNWEHSFTNQYKYENGQEIQYTVSADPVDKYTAGAITGDAATGYSIPQSYTPEKVSIPVSINWDDENNRDGKRPANLKVVLLGDGTEVKDTQLSDSNNWKDSFTNQYKYNNGQEIQYTVSADPVDKYTAGAITGDATNGYSIPQSYTPEKVSIPVSINWDDENNRDGKRPANLKVVLLGDGSEVANTQLSESTNWEHSFTNQYKYENGQEITYTVSADPVAEYTAGAITGDATNGFFISLTHTPETIDIPVSITWDDENDRAGKRPTELTVSLYGDGTYVTEVKLSESTGWQHSFTNQYKYQNGQEIQYTISVDPVDGYTPTVTGSTTSGYTIALPLSSTPDSSNGSESPKGSSIWLIETVTPTPTETSTVLPTETEITSTGIPTNSTTEEKNDDGFPFWLILIALLILIAAVGIGVYIKKKNT